MLSAIWQLCLQLFWVDMLLSFALQYHICIKLIEKIGKEFLRIQTWDISDVTTQKLIFYSFALAFQSNNIQ